MITTREHLVDDKAKAVPVDWKPIVSNRFIVSSLVIRLLKHFRSHVLKGTTESVSLLELVKLYAPTEIANFDDVALFDQDVLRLDITVHQVVLVAVLDG